MATAAATLHVFLAGLVLAIVLPGVLLAQACVRWALRRLGARVWVRRTVMLAPALVLAFGVFHETNGLGGRQSRAVAGALAGHVPVGIRNLHVHEDASTDYVLRAYFECDPDSLRQILEKPPFARAGSGTRKFSLSSTGFSNLPSRPDVPDAIAFYRTDLNPTKGSCEILTDSMFSFAYITYGID